MGSVWIDPIPMAVVDPPWSEDRGKPRMEAPRLSPNLSVSRAIVARAMRMSEWSGPWRTAVYRYAQRIEKVLPDLRLGDLTVLQVEAVQASFGPHHHEANRCLSVLSSTWRWAQGRDMVPATRRNPVEQVKRYAEPLPCWSAPAGRLLELDQVIAEAAKRGKLGLDRALALRLLVHTARRPSEIMHAPVSAVRVAEKLLHLAHTKIGQPQQVPLEGIALVLAVEAVELAESKGSTWLFSRPRDPSRPMALQTMRNDWLKVCAVAEAMGVDPTRSDNRRMVARDLRALGITEMSRAGISPHAIAKAVGHKRTETTTRYLRLGLEDARVAQRALQGRTTMELGQATCDDDKKPAPNNGPAIRRLREAKGWTQQQLADELGVSRPRASQIENLGIAKCDRVAAALGVTEVEIEKLAKLIELEGEAKS